MEYAALDIEAMRVSSGCDAGRGLKHQVTRRGSVWPPVSSGCDAGRGLKPHDALPADGRRAVSSGCDAGRGLKLVYRRQRTLPRCACRPAVMPDVD